MKSHTAAVLYVALMAAVIAVTDLIFFRGRLWARLIANVVIVLIFAAVYFKFLRRP